MKKNLLTAGVLLLGLTAHAQLTYVGNTAVVTVTANTLVYNGGGFKVDVGGTVNNGGNVMLVGSGSDKFETAGTGNFTLKDNAPGNFTMPSYGQLFISGFTQTNLNSGVVNKEYQVASNGSYQQMALPFSNKIFSSLGNGTSNGDFGAVKTFSNSRYSQNEILKWDAFKAVSRNTDIATVTSDPTGYYMVGGKNLNVSTTMHTIKGIPFASGVSIGLSSAGSGANYGTGGNGRNVYNEKFNTYLGDEFFTGTAWTGDYGKNIYQYGNPYFTNLDLSNIYINDLTTAGDGNFINNIQGIRVDGTYTFTAVGGTVNSGEKYITFTTATPGVPNTYSPSVPVGDINWLIIKPMQTFVMKLRDGTAKTLNFDNLRRFNYTTRIPSTTYSVTAARSAGAVDTVKQLGILALDQDGNELGRTYYVVYNDGTSGHAPFGTTQVSGQQSNVIGTYEENSIKGGVDSNYASQYWLYINEANEQDFKGKALPMSIFGTDVKSLKFEIRENGALVDSGVHNLSAGTGFYYEAANGKIQEAAQDEVVPVSATQYSLFYGQPEATLATDASASKTSRTQVAFNPAINNYIVKFDSDWKKADIQVYDMSGKLVISKKNVSTNSDFVIQLNKDNRAYIVTAVSEKGVKATAKIVR